MIEIGKYAGFCGGVNNSVTKAFKLLEENNNLYCLGELVHNSDVIKSLEAKGLTIINSLDEVENNTKVIVRAHGVTKDIYEIASIRNIELFDLTCPKVLKIHEMADEYSNNNYFIILVGNKEHPEVKGTFSFCGDNCCIIEDIDEIDSLKKSNNTSLNNILIIAQTTFKESLFISIVDKIKESFSKSNIKVENTICNATHLRQKECEEMAKNKECMIIIGGKNSSNTKKLYEISSKFCKNTFLIENINELDIEKVIVYSEIGIIAGASTPNNIIKEVENALSK